MKSIDVYLTFDGNCREAMTFYSEALNAPLEMMPGGDMPGAADTDKNRILHARIHKGGVRLMASDTMSMTPFKLQQGNNFSISVDCESPEEQDRYVAKLQQGGTLTMPLQDTFWGARFGMLTDKFGIQWMFNFDKPQSQEKSD